MDAVVYVQFEINEEFDDHIYEIDISYFQAGSEESFLQLINDNDVIGLDDGEAVTGFFIDSGNEDDWGPLAEHLDQLNYQYFKMYELANSASVIHDEDEWQAYCTTYVEQHFS